MYIGNIYASGIIVSTNKFSINQYIFEFMIDEKILNRYYATTVFVTSHVDIDTI